MITAQTPVEKLPDDIHLLQQMVLQLLADVDDKTHRLQDLQSQLDWLRRHTFGRRSEKYDPKEKLLFDLLDKLEDAEPKAFDHSNRDHALGLKETAKDSKTSGRNGRKPLPKDLPRERIEHLPDQDALCCQTCGRQKQRIGEEITEELDYVPASFVVRQHVRGKYACKACQDGVVIADLPARPIEKGRPGVGLLAHILTSKYADHLPLHRQEGIFKRHGLDIRRSTMCDWVGQSADLLAPLVQEMKRQILLSPKIHTDDTSVPVRNGPRKQIRKGYLWVYIDVKNNVVFDYTPNRCREGPMGFLDDYSGYLQADAYAGYDAVFEKGWATEVGCWSHARRKFYDAKETDPARGHEMLVLIGQLYKIERQAKDEKLDAAEIKALRQEYSRPILDRIKRRLETFSIEVLPKSPMGQAIGYARGQWDALNRYLENGILSIDNNLSERTLRMVVIGRKNWLFAGHDNGGLRAAIIYSLIASCKLCHIDPFAYLQDVLERVSTHPASGIADLIPANWKPSTK
ncbi:MAG: IS66 family transposase [Proteobacteria bacterium]|nr:IS66 family transposase [Pseudomonadota bacterium]